MSTSSKKKKARPSSLLSKSYKLSLSSYELSSGPSIETYLGPRLFKDPSTMMNIKDRIGSGDICIIRNTFVPDFAEAIPITSVRGRWLAYVIPILPHGGIDRTLRV